MRPLEQISGVGLFRLFDPDAIAESQDHFVRETLRWVSPTGRVRPVEFMIHPEWLGSGIGPSAWAGRYLSYTLQWQRGELYSLREDLDTDEPDDFDRGDLQPSSAVPATGIRVRLDAREVNVVVRVGHPDIITVPTAVRASIVEVDTTQIPRPAPHVDYVFLGGESVPRRRRFPVCTREWRLWPSDLEMLESDSDLDVHVYAPDGATVIQTLSVAELQQWRVVPFDGYSWASEIAADIEIDALAEYR